MGLDCANGSSWNIAQAVFDGLGADTTVINAEHNGLNINLNIGSTPIEGLQKLMVEKGLDVGFPMTVTPTAAFVWTRKAT